MPGHKEWFFDCDQKVIHGEFYKPAVNLRKAFDILEAKIKEIVQEDSGERILITADHGATCIQFSFDPFVVLQQ